MWSLENNSTENPVSSANSSTTSVDSYTAGQHRAAAAVRGKSLSHINSGQQTPPPTQDLEYLVTHTKPVRCPEPITPYSPPQGMSVERKNPTRFQEPQYATPSTQGSVSTIDLGEYHDNKIDVHGHTRLHSAHKHSSETNITSCGAEERYIIQGVTDPEDNGEASMEERLDNLARDPPKNHSVGATTEGGILNDHSTPPPRPKSRIANYLQRISRNLTPKNGVLRRALSFIPTWLSHRRHKREATPVVVSNDAGGGRVG